MIVKKFLHSCLLLEDNGKKLLIDPGEYSFIENKLTPVDIGPVGAVIITHSHPDHCFPEALKYFAANGAQITASADIAELLQKENLKCEVINANEEKQIAGFSVKAIEAPHEQIPFPAPHNFAFLINGKLLHPGDSLSFPQVKCEIYAMPVAGPWMTLVHSFDVAKKLKPKWVVPIHDALLKYFILERYYANIFKPNLEKEGINFHALELGQELMV